MVIKRYGDLVSGTVFFIFSITLYVLSFGIKVSKISKYGGTTLPRAVAITMFLLSLVQIASGIIQARARARQIVSADKPQLAMKNEASHDSLWPLFQTTVVMIVYVALLKYVGYIIMTSLAVFILIFILSGYDKKKLILGLSISVMFSVSAYFIFLKFFYLILPAGILG